MAEGTLRVVARMKAKADRIEDLKALLVGLIAPTRAEAGCIAYELLQNREDPAEFTFVEEWTDEGALDAHFQTDHLQNALSVAPDLLAEELDVRRYDEVG